MKLLAVFDIPIASFRIFEPISSSTCTVVSEGTKENNQTLVRLLQSHCLFACLIYCFCSVLLVTARRCYSVSFLFVLLSNH